MSKRTPARRKRTRAADGGATAGAVYVYCVGEASALAPLTRGDAPPSIEPPAPVELLTEGELAAVLSGVPLADYGEEALAARLSDPAWTAARAMRHELLVEHFSRRATVVPLRFGTIYLRRERVAEMLTERGAELRAALARLAGHEEWGVNVYVERAQLHEAVARLSATLRELDERAAASPPGQAYLLRKRLDALRAEEARAETLRAAAEIERRLRTESAASARLRLSKNEANGRGELAAKFAFLVARTRFEEFRRAAERLAGHYHPFGFRLELTGPWPAYNFVAAGPQAERE